MLANRDGALSGDDPDAVHDMRVASRRLRTAIDLFGDHLPNKRVKQATKHLRATTRALGGPRELDVQLGMLRTLRKRATGDAEGAAIESAQQDVDAKRVKQGRKMHDALAAIDFDAVRKTLGDIAKAIDDWNAPDLHAAAWALIEPLIVPALRDVPALREREDPAAMHTTRIAIKRLRYAIELLEAAFVSEHKALRDHMRDLQDLLGDHHDLHVLEQWLADRLARLQRKRCMTLAAGTSKALSHVRGKLTEQYAAFVAHSTDLTADAFANRVRAAMGLLNLRSS